MVMINPDARPLAQSIGNNLSHISLGGELQLALAQGPILSPCCYPLEIALMYTYPVLECLVAFAIVFSIGFLVADSNRGAKAAVPKGGVTRT